MLRAQDITILLHNGFKVDVLVVDQPSGSFRAMMSLPANDAKFITWHERPEVHLNAQDAFNWVVEHVTNFCEAVKTEIGEISNAGVAQFISAADQQQALRELGIAASVRVNGVLI